MNRVSIFIALYSSKMYLPQVAVTLELPFVVGTLDDVGLLSFPTFSKVTFLPTL